MSYFSNLDAHIKDKFPWINLEGIKNPNYKWIIYITDDKRIETYAKGYDLNDTRNPPVMYEMDGYFDYGLIEIVSLESDEVKVIKEEDFWAIT
jgi:hypothetical protein